MNVYSKSLNVGKEVATIKLVNGYPVRNGEDELNRVYKLKAIYCLLGAYNEVGRKIDFEEYKKVEEVVRQSIDKIAYLLEKADSE